MKGGLLATPEDPRDFSLGAVFSLPKLSELPEVMELPYLDTQADQRDSDFCTAYTTCAMSAVQETVPLEPSYSFAVSKVLQGDVDGWGCDLRNACKAHLEGALNKESSPYNLQNKSSDFLRRFSNWPILKEKVYPYRKKTYFKVTGQYDHFDNIRASIFKFHSPVGIGVNFGWDASKKFLDYIPKGGYGHAMPVMGFTTIASKEYCILMDSYPNAGDKRKHYITREVLNYFVEKYGAYMFTDITREEAEYRISTGSKAGDNWFVTFLSQLIHLFK